MEICVVCVCVVQLAYYLIICSSSDANTTLPPPSPHTVTQGPQGTVVEVTSEGEEVWRYVSPVVATAFPGSVQLIQQGSTTFGPDVGSRSLFR
jgi:hypothetical protein